MIVMVQKEVADSIVAKSGNMSLLSVSVHLYGKPSIVSYVPAKCFYPKPEVDSVVIKIYTGITNKNRQEEKKLFRLAKIGFSSKRKMLKNNLSSGLHISHEEAEEKLILGGFNPRIRAQDLSVDDWRKLTEIFVKNF